MSDLARAIETTETQLDQRRQFEVDRDGVVALLFGLTRIGRATWDEVDEVWRGRPLANRLADHEEFGRQMAKGALEAADVCRAIGLDVETVEAFTLGTGHLREPWMHAAIASTKESFLKLMADGEAALDEVTRRFAEDHERLAEFDPAAGSNSTEGGQDSNYPAGASAWCPRYFGELALAVKRWDGPEGTSGVARPQSNRKKPTKCQMLAWESLKWVEKERPDLIPKRVNQRVSHKQWAHIRENGCPAYEGLTVPAYESWSRYTRDVRAYFDGPAASPRADREHGSSIVQDQDI